jgi:hypothetical protein
MAGDQYGGNDPANPRTAGNGGYGYQSSGFGAAPKRDDGYAVDANSPGKVRDNSEFGGYRGVRRPDGTIDYSQSGRGDEERYYQGLGNAYANRGAYQANFDPANQDRSRAQQARGMQGDAANIYRQAALGYQTPDQALGAQMLQTSQLQQQGAAVSGEGNGIARAAMLRNQQNAQGAYDLRGTQALQAQRADDMARAREGYMQALTQQRSDDLAGQQLAAQQAQYQGQSEQAQRQLNDQGQQWGEQQGFNVNAASQQGALERQGLNTTRYAQDIAQQQQDANRDSKWGAAAVSAVSTGVGAGIGSDERMKSNVRGLAHAYRRAR